jgi:hypothetical protein
MERTSNDKRTPFIPTLLFDKSDESEGLGYSINKNSEADSN